MQQRPRTVASLILILSMPSVIFADPAVLPGDRGRPFDGFLPLAVGAAGSHQQTVDPHPAISVPPRHAPAPPLSLASRVAGAIAESCKQFPLAIAVVDSIGTPKLVLVPDGSEGWHGYSAVRKAWTALKFQVATIDLARRIPADPALQAKVRADDNLMAFSGGRLWKINGEVVGAVAVSGAEPGSHDDDCLLLGTRKLERELSQTGSTIL